MLSTEPSIVILFSVHATSTSLVAENEAGDASPRSAKIPAATSSSTIPAPSGSLSSCRTGGGLTISNALKSIRPARKVFHASGTAISAMSCPATSSITTNCGSFVAEARATRVAAGMPISVTSAARAMATGVRSEGGNSWATAAQITTVAADAQVPGPGCRRPIPKKVATRVAQSGAVGRDPSTSLRAGSATAGGTPALRSGGASGAVFCGADIFRLTTRWVW